MNSQNKNKLFNVTIILLLLLNTAVVVFMLIKKDTHHLPPHKKQQRGGGFEFLVKELVLDTNQTTQYEILRQQHQQKIDSLREEKKRLKDLFFSFMKTSETADTNVQKKLDTIAMVDRKVDELTFIHFKKLRAICNAQQQAKFDAIIMDALHSQKPPKAERPGNEPPPHRGKDGEEPPPPPNE